MNCYQNLEAPCQHNLEKCADLTRAALKPHFSALYDCVINNTTLLAALVLDKISQYLEVPTTCHPIGKFIRRIVEIFRKVHDLKFQWSQTISWEFMIGERNQNMLKPLKSATLELRALTRSDQFLD